MFFDKNKDLPLSDDDIPNIHEVIDLKTAFSALTSNELRENYLLGFGAIIIAAGLFYTGYQVSRLRQPADRIADALESLNEKADIILNTAKKIEEMAADLAEKIKHLIIVISGKIEEAHLRDAMAKARAIIFNIMEYYSSEEKYLKGLSDINRLREGLTEAIEQIREFSGDSTTSFFIQAGPYIAKWIQAYEAYEYGYFVKSVRAQQEALNASPYTPKKFTDSPYFKFLLSKCKLHFTNLASIHAQFSQFLTSEDFLRDDAKYGYRFDEIKMKFVKLTSPPVGPKTAGTPSDFKFSVQWETDAEGRKINVNLYCRRIFPPPYKSSKFVKVAANSEYAIEREAFVKFTKDHKNQMQDSIAIDYYNEDAKGVEDMILNPAHALKDEEKCMTSDMQAPHSHMAARL